MKDHIREKIDKLEKIRKAKNMTVQEFAKSELSVTRQTYYNWQAGENPNLENWDKIREYIYKEG